MAVIYKASREIDYSIALICVFIYGFFIATIKNIELLLFVPILVQFLILRIDLKKVLKKVIKVNLFIAITFLILFLEDKLQLALLVFFRANLILWFTLSFGFSGFTLYEALNNLHLSKKFSMVLFFTVKYIEILFMEASKLKEVIMLRGFKEKFKLTSLKVYANLISFLIFKTISRLNIVEDLIDIRCRDGFLIPAKNIKVGLDELILIFTILGVVFVYYFK